jgi:hypothetical protein
VFGQRVPLHKNELLCTVYTCANGDRCHLWRSSSNGCMVAFCKAPVAAADVP